jgi:hypothetical protein
MKKYSFFAPHFFFAGFIFLLFLSTTPLLAQRLSFGLRGGAYTGTYSPKEEYYKGEWEKSTGGTLDLLARVQISHHLYAQLGLGFYQRRQKGFSEVSAFQGGFELEGQQTAYYIPFMFGYYTANPLSKWYGFGALGFSFGSTIDKAYERAIWFKAPADVRTNGEESAFLIETGGGYFLRSNIQLELNLRFQASQFNTFQKQGELSSNWYLKRWNPGLSVIYRTR